ncbi:MAG: hypothetical protein JSS61_05660 [Verrucomicrobia bacterium]|nr:hypothetical protein [Verrucomicrobiota bacterium]
MGIIRNPSFLYVGDDTATRLLQEELAESSLQVAIDPRYRGPDLYARDLLVTRLDGKLLLPNPIENYRLHHLFKLHVKALKMRTPTEFVHPENSDIGEGAEICGSSLQLATSLHLSHIRGATTVEGGNCHLFTMEGAPKAIVGINTVYITLVNLEKKHLMPYHELLEEAPVLEEHFYQARNHQIFHQFCDFVQYGISCFDAVKNTTCPLLKSKLREKFKKYNECAEVLHPYPYPFDQYSLPLENRDVESARRIAKKIAYVKTKIAEEIGVPLSEIAFIPQVAYHIDLETLYDPTNNTVYLQDEQQVIDLLREDPWDRFGPFIENARKRQARLPVGFLDEVEQEIQKIGCRTRRVAGHFEKQFEEIDANFLNGLCLDGKLITIGSKCGIFEEIFRNTLRKAGSQLEIRFLHNESLYDMVRESEAGIRCLTWLC